MIHVTGFGRDHCCIQVARIRKLAPVLVFFSLFVQAAEGSSYGIVPYIDKAGKDNAQLVVFPEYVLGRIPVPGPTTKKISAAAAANSIEPPAIAVAAALAANVQAAYSCRVSGHRPQHGEKEKHHFCKKEK